MNWLLILSSLIFTHPDESYIVVHVQGIAYVNRAAGPDTLSRGERVMGNDTVRFANNRGLIRVSGIAGSFCVRADQQVFRTSITRSEFWVILKNALIPSRKEGEMRARNGYINNLVSGKSFFAQFSEENSSMLIMAKQKIELGDYFSRDTANRFFYYSFTQDGEVINKKIPLEKSNGKLFLVFDPRLFHVDGKPLAVDSLSGTIGFYERANKKINELTTLHLQRVDLDSLKEELCLVAQGIEPGAGDGKTFPKELRQSLLDYTFSWYGVPDREYFLGAFLDQLKCQP